MPNIKASSSSVCNWWRWRCFYPAGTKEPQMYSDGSRKGTGVDDAVRLAKILFLSKVKAHVLHWAMNYRNCKMYQVNLLNGFFLLILLWLYLCFSMSGHSESSFSNSGCPLHLFSHQLSSWPLWTTSMNLLCCLVAPSWASLHQYIHRHSSAHVQTI